MSTAEPRSPAGAILAQFAEGLRERAREVGVGHAEAPELVEPSFRGGDESTAARLRLDDLPEACLLYTSPSPRDATLSRMPSSA